MPESFKDHVDYMLEKRHRSITEWQEVMQLNGMFKDIEKIKTIQDNLKEDGESNE